MNQVVRKIASLLLSLVRERGCLFRDVRLGLWNLLTRTDGRTSWGLSEGVPEVVSKLSVPSPLSGTIPILFGHPDCHLRGPATDVDFHQSFFESGERRAE